MKFNFIDLILLLGVSQGIFLGFTILFVCKNNRKANKILSLLLFSATLMLIGRIFLFKYYTPLLYRLAMIFETVIFIFGPLLYAYTNKLLTNHKKNLAFYHYVPAIIHLIYSLGLLFINYTDLIAMIRAGRFDFIYFTTEFLALLSNIFYFSLTYLMIKKYKMKEKNELSYTQNVYQYLSFIIFGISASILFWIISFSNYFLKFEILNYISYSSIWISLTVFIYIVGFYSLKQPEIFRVQLQNKKYTVKKERVNDQEIERLTNELDNLMINNKIYLNHKLTLSQLAKELKTSTNNLSWLLNNVHKSNFYDYINTYRIEDFIQKIRKGEHLNHTLLALSLDSGFNSKSTFNKAFKTIMQQTPTEYIKNLSISV
ncbi:AraC family transcriptional regulator [uncultured Tenacibaculum sp.]|uniref:helix-turn-helix domain-containing protein n=1 Tax=uncultured Tenacibaculum sp. TaxID=174713 RepID=UPI002619ACC1|nr:helix-turn-helix domain-containing protein [uncultured Tenacibaculum sp.]